uniref:Interferon stimulated exonuclease gene n=1 Tax=Salarias fasciatus TaxID=181472 RepID=A0A672FJ49_SALFA
SAGQRPAAPMVGTGPGGRCSELARCSIVDYHGHPVTDFRTRWSGIKKHHLHNATPFTEARESSRYLKAKVVVGHSIYHDFEALDILHPGHMVRDTSTVRLLGRLAGFPRGRCTSLKVLTRKLLNRNIQVGRSGHCSVEDARASLDLYKLVEGEWEQELQKSLRDRRRRCRCSAGALLRPLHAGRVLAERRRRKPVREQRWFHSVSYTSESG